MKISNAPPASHKWQRDGTRIHDLEPLGVPNGICLAADRPDYFGGN